MKPQIIAEWTHREVETLLHSVARYTRFVRSTKVVLGTLAFVLMAMMLFYVLNKNENAGVRVAFTSIEKGPATPTRMINAHFHGLDKSNQPFNVTAKTATEAGEDKMYLDMLTGDITLKTGVWLSVSSNSGVLDMKAHELDLKGAIEMFDDEGYEFRTETAHVDIAKKTAISHDKVDGQGPLGTLHAHGFFAEGGKQKVTFDGPVLVTVYPQNEEKKNAAPAVTQEDNP